MNETLEYDLFISYAARPDRRVARRLHAFLETIHSLADRDDLELRELRVCIDGAFSTRHIQRESRSDQITSEELVARHLALSHSLLVLASRRAATTYWVPREIELWLAQRSPDRIQVAVTDGPDPASLLIALFSNSETASRLASMSWYDLRGYRWWRRWAWSGMRDLNETLIALASHYLECDPRDIAPIWALEQRRNSRRRLAWVSATLGVVSILLAITTWLAVALAHRNTTVVAQRDDARCRALVIAARDARDDFPQRSILYAAEAVGSGDGTESTRALGRSELRTSLWAAADGLGMPGHQGHILVTYSPPANALFTSGSGGRVMCSYPTADDPFAGRRPLVEIDEPLSVHVSDSESVLLLRTRSGRYMAGPVPSQHQPWSPWSDFRQLSWEHGAVWSLSPSGEFLLEWSTNDNAMALLHLPTGQISRIDGLTPLFPVVWGAGESLILTTENLGHGNLFVCDITNDRLAGTRPVATQLRPPRRVVAPVGDTGLFALAGNLDDLDPASGAVQLWDSSSLTLLDQISVHDASKAFPMSASQDGSRLVLITESGVFGETGILHLIGIADGQLSLSSSGSLSPIVGDDTYSSCRRIEFSADSQTAYLSQFSGGHMAAIDTTTGEVKWAWRGPQLQESTLLVAPNDSDFAVAEGLIQQSRSLFYTGTMSRSEPPARRRGFEAPVWDAVFTPHWLVGASSDGVPRAFRRDGHLPLPSGWTREYRDTILQAKPLGTERLVAIAGSRLTILRLNNGESLFTADIAPSLRPAITAADKTGQHLLVGSGDQIYLLHIPTEHPADVKVTQPPGVSGPIQAAVILSDGPVVVLCDKNGDTWTIGPGDATPQQAPDETSPPPSHTSSPRPRPSGRRILEFSKSPDERWLVGECVSGSPIIWAVTDGALRQVRLPGAETLRVTRGIAFSEDSRWLAIRDLNPGAAQAVWVWDLHSAASDPVRIAEGKSLKAMTFSPDSRWLAVGCGQSDTGDTSLLVWRCQDWATPIRVDGFTGQVSLHAWSPDSEQLLVGDWSDTPQVLRFKDNRLLDRVALHVHRDLVVSVGAYDDSRFWTAGRDGQVRLWSLSTTTPVSELVLTFDDWVRNVTVIRSDNTASFIGTGRDGRLSASHMGDNLLLDSARQITGRGLRAEEAEAILPHELMEKRLK